MHYVVHYVTWRKVTPTQLSFCAFPVLIMNDELMERLAKKRGSAHRTPPRTADRSAPLNYQSPPAEVQAWFMAKGFSHQLSTRHQQKSAHKKNQSFHFDTHFCSYCVFSAFY